MSLRPPSRYTASAIGVGHGSGNFNALDHEIAGEKASALGRAGERVEKTLQRLETAQEADRDALLNEAAKAVYAYFIQRELCGMRRHQDVIREYRIPRAVLARLGAS